MRIASTLLVLAGLCACVSTTGEGEVVDQSTNVPSPDARTPSGGRSSEDGSGVASAGDEQQEHAGADGQPDASPPSAPAENDAGVLPTDDSVDTPDATPPDQCNDVAQAGEATTMVDRVAFYDRTQLGGGVLTDGTYVLTEVTHYVESSHVDGRTTSYGRETLVVRGGAIDDVFEYLAGDSVRFTATLVASGSRLQMTTGCTWSEKPGTHYPEIGDWAPLSHLDNSFAATATSITVWTPRGNHESIVRVYTKAP